MGQHDLNWINPIGLCPLPLLANRESASTLWSFPKVLNCFQRTVSCNSNVNCWGQNQWKSYSSSKYKFKTHLFHFRFFFLLPWRTEVKVTQSCLTLWDPMDYTVHGILQAGILEWVAFPFSRVSSQPRNQTRVSCIAGGFYTNWAIREAHMLKWGSKKHLLPWASPLTFLRPSPDLSDPTLKMVSLTKCSTVSYTWSLRFLLVVVFD